MALLTRYFHSPPGLAAVSGEAEGGEQHSAVPAGESFTFLVTRAVTRDAGRDVTSKEFAHAGHRWAVSFSREDKVSRG